MKRKRFSVEQIAAIVTQAEMGMPVAELIRRVGDVLPLEEAVHGAGSSSLRSSSSRMKTAG